MFQYQTFRAAGACLTAFLLCVFFGNRVILKLTALKVGQPIRTKEEVNQLAELHGGKTGTPTMGGILIVGAVLISTLLWAQISNPFIQVLMFVTIGAGLLGFVDDYIKVKKKTSAGVSGRVKLAAQFLISFVAIGYLYFNPDTGDFIRQLYLPSLKYPLIPDMG
ncbi:MAG: phospho-N-acetylmuramoyl-pentapeptide-transferase, partial [Verrucomicrobiota bacterium]